MLHRHPPRCSTRLVPLCDMATPEVLAALASAEAASADLGTAIETALAKEAVLNSRLGSLRVAIEYVAPVPPPDPTPVPTPVPIPVPIGAQVGAKIATCNLQVGWVHTQTDRPLTASRAAILAKSAPIQGQHIQGFGAGKIWPTQSGPKDWSSLDRLFGPPGHPELGVMKDAKRRILYLCGVPGWMKRPVPGTTLTQSIPLGDPLAEYDYTPPHVSQYPTAAAFAAEIVTRYPQITDVVVWNELKGYWANNRWDIEDYTRFYNLTYKAVKAARPGVQVGGPYTVLRSIGWRDVANWSPELSGSWGHTDQRIINALKYWLTNAVGADFFAVDIRNSNSDYAQDDFDAPKFDLPVWQTNPEKGINPTFWPNGSTPWSSWAKIPAFMAWYHSQPRLNDKPVYFMETYANSRVNNFNTLFPNNPESPIAAMASVAGEGFRQMAVSGVAGALHWSPDGDSRGRSNPLALYNSSGVATPMAPICQAMAEHFAPGTDLFNVTGLPGGISALASATHLLVISANVATTAFTLDGKSLTLNPYEVRLVSRA